jgi:recombination DNA repair RAD52 pathway protein
MPPSQRAESITSGHHDTSIDSQLLDVDDMYGNSDLQYAQDSTFQDARTRQTVSPTSITNTNDSRIAAIQSVETAGRFPSTHTSGSNATSSDEPQVSHPGPRGRKRAASQPSEHEPATFRSSTGSSRSSRGALNHSEGDVKIPRADIRLSMCWIFFY